MPETAWRAPVRAGRRRARRRRARLRPAGDGQDTLFAVRQRPRVLRLWPTAARTTARRWPGARHAYLNAAGDRIVCAAHGALFEPDTGLCVQGPCLGESLRRCRCTLTTTARSHGSPHARKTHSMNDRRQPHEPRSDNASSSSAAASPACRRRSSCASRAPPSTSSRSTPRWRSYGAGISLGGATLRALGTPGRAGGLPRARQRAGRRGLIRLPHGPQVAELPTPRIAGPDVPGGGAIMRPVLAHILADATRAAGTRVHLGCTFTTIEQDADGCGRQLHRRPARALRPRGRRRRPALEGARGAVPRAPKPRYSGQGVWRAVVPRPAEIETATMWIGPQGQARRQPGVEDADVPLHHRAAADNEHLDPATFAERVRALLRRLPGPPSCRRSAPALGRRFADRLPPARRPAGAGSRGRAAVSC